MPAAFFHRLVRGATPLALALLAAPAPAGTLPDELELRYNLYYGKVHAGRTVKTLTRAPNGEYFHRTRTQPDGLAKLFTSTEWFEEGYFRVHLGAVQPLRFLKYRVGSGKSHRHSVVFDWDKASIRFQDGREERLPPGTQDEGSVLYAFMLRPPAAAGEQGLAVTNGKKLLRFRYVSLGDEALDTPLGRIATRVLRRLPEGGREGQELTLWLAPARDHVPVQIRAREDGREATMVIETIGRPQEAKSQ